MKNYKRVLAVGDVHGHFTEFISLYEKLNFSADDLLIMLGDIISGGKENLKMLRWAMEMISKDNVIILSGNAEYEFLDRFDEDDLSTIERKGKTAKELLDAVQYEPDIIQKVYYFIKNLPICYSLKISDEQKFFFCHAGIDPKKPLNKQSKITLLETRPKKFAEDYNGDTLIVVGHTRVQKYFKDDSQTVPRKIPGKNILLMDTGIKKGGLISCVDVLSDKYWQSDPI